MKESTQLILFFFAFVGITYFGYQHQQKTEIIKCYQERDDSFAFPETYFIQPEQKEFCKSKGIIIKEIGIDY